MVIDGLITRQLFTNASAARIYGGELELEATPAKGLTISMNAAYLNATYRNFISAGTDYSGNVLPSAPRINIQTAVDFRQPVSFGAIVANVSASYRSKVFFDTANTARLSDPGRVFVDGRLGVQFGRNKLEIGIWAKNIFKETNISDMTPIPTLGFEVVSDGPPRTYGLHLRGHF